MKSHNPKITGIVVEYNPFHNGHIYHIQKARELTNCDVLIAVMSPNYVQRGEPAIIDKWTRTHAALNNGVDIVLELPTIYTLQSAEYFAYHSVNILKNAGVDTLVYGNETLEKPTLNVLDHSKLNAGFSYAHSKNTDAKQPNSILGAYYEQACASFDIKTVRILRTNHYHELQLTGTIASASAIRNAVYDLHDINNVTPLDIHISDTFRIDDYYPFIRHELISHRDDLKQRFLMREGLENLLYENAVLYSNWQDFLNHSTSKRYTASRIRRTVLHVYLNTKELIPKSPSIRILGMNQNGQAYIKTQKKKALLTPSFKNYFYKDAEERATLLYALPYPKRLDTLLKQEKSGPIILP